MTTTEYEEGCLNTAKYLKNSDMFVASILGITSEAGEIAGKLEKRIRKGKTSSDFLTPKELITFRDEIGDTLYFLTTLSISLGYTLNDIMQANHDKLADRNKRDVIHGEGDNR